MLGHIRRDSGYWVKGLENKDIPEIYKLCSKNTIFYQYHPPFVTEKSILQDMTALPPGKEPWEKAFLGFYEGERLIAILEFDSELSEGGDGLHRFVYDGTRGTGARDWKRADWPLYRLSCRIECEKGSTGGR